MADKITAVSLNRYRAHAADQKRLGLKVGGTLTVFSVEQGAAWLRIEAHGATPGERKTHAIECFKLGRDTAWARIVR